MTPSESFDKNRICSPYKKINDKVNITKNSFDEISQDISYSPSESLYVVAGCSANIRLDGRTCLDYRPYTLDTCDSSSGRKLKYPFVLSNGSSRLFLPGSTTDILCSVKAEIVKPPPCEPDRCIIDLNLDILNTLLYNGSYDKKILKSEEKEVSSILRSILLPYVVDRKNLCIIPNWFVWKLNIDVIVLNCDGNLIDATSFAIWGALQNILLPKVTPLLPNVNNNNSKENVNDFNKMRKMNYGANGSQESNFLALDEDVANAIIPKGVKNCPIVVTIFLVPIHIEKNDNPKSLILSSKPIRVKKVRKRGETVMFIDARNEEEMCFAPKISTSVDRNGNICGVHTYGSSLSQTIYGNINSCDTIPFETLKEITKIASLISRKAYRMLDSCNDDRGVDELGDCCLQSHIQMN